MLRYFSILLCSKHPILFDSAGIGPQPVCRVILEASIEALVDLGTRGLR
jgi:hypothetical protein